MQDLLAEVQEGPLQVDRQHPAWSEIAALLDTGVGLPSPSHALLVEHITMQKEEGGASKLKDGLVAVHMHPCCVGYSMHPTCLVACSSHMLFARPADAFHPHSPCVVCLPLLYAVPVRYMYKIWGRNALLTSLQDCQTYLHKVPDAARYLSDVLSSIQPGHLRQLVGAGGASSRGAPAAALLATPLGPLAPGAPAGLPAPMDNAGEVL